VTGSLSYSQVVGNRSNVDDSPVSLNTPAPLLAQSNVAPLPADFMICLTNCLADLFSLSLHQESPLKSRSLITAAVHKHFSDVLTVSNLTAPKSTNVFAPTDHTCVALDDHPVATLLIVLLLLLLIVMLLLLLIVLLLLLLTMMVLLVG